ncbi:MAG TPA: contractile injection system tape measure protein [Chryseolinea sp.]|nr:contractile injection system tape measure protein [Chryseolinea sp.]
MATSIHYIHKQQLNFTFHSEVRASIWTKDASRFFREEVNPALCDILDRYAKNDKVYLIDKIEIDLGRIPAKNIKSLLLKRFNQEFTALIKDYHNRSIYPDHSRDWLGESRRKAQDHDDTHVSGSTLIAMETRQNILKAFYAFLDLGILPWESNLTTNKQLEHALLQEYAIASLARMPETYERLTQPRPRSRFRHQFSKRFVHLLFQNAFSTDHALISCFNGMIRRGLRRCTLDPLSIEGIRHVIAEVPIERMIASEFNPPDLAISIIHEQLDGIERLIAAKHTTGDYKLLLANLLLTGRQHKSGEVTDRVLEIAAAYPGISQHLRKDRFEKDTTTNTSNRRGKTEEDTFDSGMAHADGVVADEAKNHHSSLQDSSDTVHSQGEANSGNAKGPGNFQPIHEIVEPDKRPPGNSVTTAPETTLTESRFRAPKANSAHQTGPTSVPDEIYLDHAGLILCWPYLSKLFERLSYLLNGAFQNTASQERAIQVLGYIATGHDRCEEHELSIAKILTNWPFQMPLGYPLKLRRKEMREAEIMIANLIANWSILKDTSIDGVRSSFFQRRGKLLKDESGWRLIVEQKSYDMLLDHLPYGISLIKLPWNMTFIRVDWT